MESITSSEKGVLQGGVGAIWSTSEWIEIESIFFYLKDIDKLDLEAKV